MENSMEIHKLQMMAGFTSGIVFMTGSLPMLFKAFKTKDLRSYSVVQLAMSNFGNVLYWLYLASLPVGPIWFLQGFTTVSTALMLIFYLRYGRRQSAAGPPGLARSVAEQVKSQGKQSHL